MARPRSLSISSQRVTKSRLFFTNYTLISGITSIQISCYSIKLVIDKQKITFPFLKIVKFHLLCHFIKINSVKPRLSQHLPVECFPFIVNMEGLPLLHHQPDQLVVGACASTSRFACVRCLSQPLFLLIGGGGGGVEYIAINGSCNRWGLG